ncbi:hypothetical protein H6G89_04945 [Oscillatoria sp. FACHB-1407]|uniref:hypothetical protein n=1 Tax=Oscillatoria sp. FACHB-1407 TaxID=2692847 RepID=UPI0016821BA8|nr:hypothetical protein [Oscillatoria sp. FACHB-1407]MBD2460385.1 hypothetical protein [Oscillatoria sp. FACHB-1407]
MRHVSLFATAGIFALWLGGCGGSPPADPSVGQPPTGTPIPASPAPGAPSPVAQAPAGTPITQPTATASPAAPAGTLPPDLISSTDPDQRLRSIQRNRPDPFALLPTTPVIERTGTTTAQAPSVPQAPAAPPAPDTSGTGALPPSQLEPENFVPPPPQADLARAVQVTGVVQIGNTVHAIVKAPNEPTSRYVRAGQYLSNGQILVKRIDMNQAEPVVVFEENGIEVLTSVGSGGAPTEPGVPAAAAIASSRQ